MTAVSTRVLTEFFDFMTGKEIGSGISRTVYNHPFDKTKIIKMEDSRGCFQNIKEWMIWDDFKYCPEIAKWLAPCHYISDSGTFLIMSKTTPMPESKIPQKLPDFLTDQKFENYGILQGRVVCHDYGTALISLESKLKKSKFHDSQR